jgi:predicted RNase H-like nuclease (RuvC/YqgF family)
MTLLQKKVYQANFNYIGEFLKDAYEKTQDTKKNKEINNLIKCINQMYIYTNQLEIEHMINKKILEDQKDENRKLEQHTNKLKKEIERYDRTFKLQSGM